MSPISCYLSSCGTNADQNHGVLVKTHKPQYIPHAVELRPDVIILLLNYFVDFGEPLTTRRSSYLVIISDVKKDVYVDRI